MHLFLKFILEMNHYMFPKHAQFHFQNKFEALVHLVCFIIRKFVTTHGHMNVIYDNFYRCTVHFDIISFSFTNKCTFTKLIKL
jgi:hypothetical protein